MQEIVRTITAKPHLWRVRIEKQHPQLGLLHRGTITMRRGQPGDGPAMRWNLVDFDHNDLGDHVGDYRDAEKALLDATSALDEPLAADELASLTV